MQVIDFNIEKGIYISRFGYFETDFHSHPPVEIIYAENGTFSIFDSVKEYPHLHFAIIDSNKKHKLIACQSDLKIIMVENHGGLQEILNNMCIGLSDGLYAQQGDFMSESIVNDIIETLYKTNTSPKYDDRVLKAITLMNTHDMNYFSMIHELIDTVNLSESRLSHLFKQNVGISLKKYFVWSKIKKTVEEHLYTKEDLFSTLINNGFYDQPHFSNVFKAMLGITPSKVYNSRILQVLTNNK
jgi:AraC-like DNA-binding protein